MTRQELKQLISEVVSEVTGAQPLSGKGYIPLRGFDHAEIPVDYKVRVYKGTSTPDDPSTLEFDLLVTAEDVTLGSLVPQTSMDEKLIQLYRLASKKLGGATSEVVVIPKGTNVIALNDALNGWIDADIQVLQDQLASKLMGNR